MKKVKHTPLLPALPVLPDLWMYVSISLGGSSCTMRSTSGISSPLAATLVATKHLSLPSLKV